jgi:hypothetical protein
MSLSERWLRRCRLSARIKKLRLAFSAHSLRSVSGMNFDELDRALVEALLLKSEQRLFFFARVARGHDATCFNGKIAVCDALEALNRSGRFGNPSAIYQCGLWLALESGPDSLANLRRRIDAELRQFELHRDTAFIKKGLREYRPGGIVRAMFPPPSFEVLYKESIRELSLNESIPLLLRLSILGMMLQEAMAVRQMSTFGVIANASSSLTAKIKNAFGEVGVDIVTLFYERILDVVTAGRYWERSKFHCTHDDQLANPINTRGVLESYSRWTKMKRAAFDAAKEYLESGGNVAEADRRLRAACNSYEREYGRPEVIKKMAAKPDELTKKKLRQLGF